VARQDAGAECEGRLPHRRDAVRPEAAVRADVLAVARGDQAACRSRTHARAQRDVRRSRAGAEGQAGRPAVPRRRATTSSRRRSKPRWNSPTPTPERETSSTSRSRRSPTRPSSRATRTWSPCPTRRSRSS
jgi:hypothetical protein